MALIKMENQPEQTVLEIQAQNPDTWFRWGADNSNNPRLIYIADTGDELLSITSEDMLKAGFMNWSDVPPKSLMPSEPLEFGGVVFDF